MKSRSIICLCILFAFSLAVPVVAENAQKSVAQDRIEVRPIPVLPRVKLTKSKHLVKPTKYPSQLIVKFDDSMRARSVNGKLTSLTGAEIGKIHKAISGQKIKFKPLINLPTSKIEALRTWAAHRSRRAQPDLAGMFVVEIPDSIAEDIANALNALPEIEFVYFHELFPPPPGDIDPTTPDYSGQQTYHNPDPGLDMAYAWASGNGEGAGIQLFDCEYGWNSEHEDLVDRALNLEPGQTIHPDVYTHGWDRHGTAVLGETSAVVNSYGCTGLVPDATVFTFPEKTVEEGNRRVTCITNAIAEANVGDVVMLEMQTTGPGGDYAPAEVNPAVWTVVKVGTDAGVIVVAAAGNGNQDLDSDDYNDYRSLGDSGAIIVGAGTSDTNHDKMDFSTHGARVNVQGWGQNVFTLGYGDYAEHGGDKNQRYTASFNGTSSATPFVASCCVSLQGLAEENLGARLTPAEMRDLLISTGISQGSGGHIGPFPNLMAAVQAILNDPPVADAGPDQIVERDSSAGAEVTLDGSASSDPDGDPITYEWTWSGSSASGINPTVTLPMGLTTVTLTVSDGCKENTDTVDITVVDTTPPEVEVVVPIAGSAVQDGVTLKALATDFSDVISASFTLRERDGGNGTPVGVEDIPATYNGATGKWEYLFDSVQLPDGYYQIFATAVDEYGNVGTSDVVLFSIRNWAIVELLPASQEYRAGRTMPIKFSLRICEAVDPAMPFVYNEQLKIDIYKTSKPGTILQSALFGDTSKDYRIDTAGELYITNFKTDKKPADYTVDIWRNVNDFLIDSFTFETQASHGKKKK